MDVLVDEHAAAFELAACQDTQFAAYAAKMMTQTGKRPRRASVASKKYSDSSGSGADSVEMFMDGLMSDELETKPSKRSRKNRSADDGAKTSQRREKNKLAARRCRAKKMQQMLQTEQELKDMRDATAALTQQIEHLQAALTEQTRRFSNLRTALINCGVPPAILEEAMNRGIKPPAAAGSAATAPPPAKPAPTAVDPPVMQAPDTKPQQLANLPACTTPTTSASFVVPAAGGDSMAPSSPGAAVASAAASGVMQAWYNGSASSLRFGAPITTGANPSADPRHDAPTGGFAAFSNGAQLCVEPSSTPMSEPWPSAADMQLTRDAVIQGVHDMPGSNAMPDAAATNMLDRSVGNLAAHDAAFWEAPAVTTVNCVDTSVVVAADPNPAVSCVAASDPVVSMPAAASVRAPTSSAFAAPAARPQSSVSPFAAALEQQLPLPLTTDPSLDLPDLHGLASLPSMPSFGLSGFLL